MNGNYGKIHNYKVWKIGGIHIMERLIELLQDIKEDIDFENETALIDDELLDSFDILQIISAIDDEFEVAIPAAMIIPDNFNSAEALWNMIQELMD